MERRGFVCSINYVSGMCLGGAWLSEIEEGPMWLNDRINRLRVRRVLWVKNKTAGLET